MWKFIYITLIKNNIINLKTGILYVFSKKEGGYIMSLGVRLRKVRKGKNLSQKEAAKRIEINNSCISNYERDYRTPQIETLVALADLYDISTDYLLGRTSNKKRNGHNYDAFEEMYLEIKELEMRKLKILEEMFKELI